MSSGYFILDSNKGMILKSITQTSVPFFSKEQVASLPSAKDKFFEIVPAVVIDVDLSDSRGRIRVKKIIGDNGLYDAYPIVCNTRIIPLIGEIVLVSEYLPAEIGTTSKLAKFPVDDETKYTNLFYHNILNTNNSVGSNRNYEFFEQSDLQNLNSKSVISSVGSKNIKLNRNFISDYFINVNPKSLFSLEGDVIFEGRSGQSIRFSQSVRKDIDFISNVDLLGSSATAVSKKRKNNVWVYGNVGGGPITIISNGRMLTDKFDSVNSLEDINTDDSSIYLSSDNIIPLFIQVPIATEISKDFINESTELSGKQILITSGRIILNAKENEIGIYSKKYISLSASKIYTKSDKITVDSTMIQLGNNASVDGSPVAKSDALVNILEELIEYIKTDVMMKNPASIAKFQSIKQRLHEIKSKTTFTL